MKAVVSSSKLFPRIEREPRASFLTFPDGSSIVLREDGKCYPSMPYPPSRGWFPGIKPEGLEAYEFFALESEDRVREIIKGGTPMKPDYCTNEGVESCRECSFSSCGRDCTNFSIVEDKACESTGEDVRKVNRFQPTKGELLKWVEFNNNAVLTCQNSPQR